MIAASNVGFSEIYATFNFVTQFSLVKHKHHVENLYSKKENISIKNCECHCALNVVASL